MKTLEEVLISRENSRRDTEELFLNNAQMRHGVPRGTRHPFDPRAVSPGHETKKDEKPEQQPSEPRAEMRTKSFLKDTLLPLVVGAALTGSGVGLYQYFQDPPVPNPGSLFQYLEDGGFHIGEEE